MRFLKTLAAAALAVLLLSGSRSDGAIAALDRVPAATLLLPYFEIDASSAPGFPGVRTWVRVGNATPNAVLAHATLWTDLGVPTISFDVYLAGFDVAEIDLRMVFAGILPRSGNAVLNRGNYSNPLVTFPGCGTDINPPRLSADQVAALRNAHRGQASSLWGNLCGGRAIDTMVRGFMTIDAVSQCGTAFPGDAGYFVTGGTGIASNANVLWGDYWTRDNANNSSEGDALVHLEASSDVRVTTPGSYTFYGRLVGGLATDNREPLATLWHTRYLSGGAFNEGTDVIAWRDPGGPVAPFACGSAPPYFPLDEEQLITFDEQEDVTKVTGVDPFPGVAGRVRLGTATFPLAFSFGAMFLDLDTIVPGGLFNPSKQSFVQVRMRSAGRFSVGLQAVPMDNATNPLNIIYPVASR